MGTKFPFFNFPVCKIYLGTLTRRARGHVGHVDTLDTPFSRFIEEVLKLRQNFRKNKVITGKTPFFVTGLFCTSHSIFLTLASDRGALYGNVAFSILVLSTKDRHSSFLKKVCIFQKIYLKVKVWKTFKISNNCHIKTF